MAKKAKNHKRLLVLADFHCGHIVGLTPPPYWRVIPPLLEEGEFDKYEKQRKAAGHERELWNWYAERIEELKPIDYVVLNGDVIDGKGERSGSREEREAARTRQCEMAAHCLDFANARQVGLIHGTAYHDGGQEDWAIVVAAMMKTPVMFISGHKFFRFGEYMFDFKHKVGRSGIPHGQATPLKRAKLWNLVWSSRKGQQPKADFLIRSHVHYYDEDYDETTRCRAFITPALQGYGSIYGTRECENTVDIGMLYFDINKDGTISWQPILADLEQQKCDVISR